MNDETSRDSGAGTATSSLPLAALKQSAGGYARALGGRAVDKLTGRVSGLSDRLTAYASGESHDDDDGDDDRPSAKAAAASKAAEKLAEGKSPLTAGLSAAASGVTEKVKGIFGGGGGGGRGGKKKFKFNNIVESIDVGAPVSVVYNAWTEYDNWPNFMKKVEKAELDDEQGKVAFKGQVFWSHREWNTTIKEQVPDKRIVWDSSGPKGHLSGAVTFHPLGDELTRLVIIVEYYPQGFFEKTANIWRAVNRRLRLELKFFVRHVMTDTILHPDDVEGYRAEIHDKEIARTHDEVMEEEQAAREAEESEQSEEPAGESYEEEPEGEAAEEYTDEEEYEPAEGEGSEDEYEEAPEEGAEGEYEEGDEYAEEAPEEGTEDEYEEAPEEGAEDEYAEETR
ncbi:putative membrane protein [Georgenia soli]|uniref:Putative membrane protein n=1 Tax=Georgenia soli TaxID=638953 RepID=A0A2A9ELH8_9MICO|nr:SRPBCC family protein [Georgenia soli]PFG39371.1 putative membrane protein [Georgenia soli]